MNESEKAHLLVLMGAEFGTRAKEKNGKSIAEIDWSEFQKVALYFYQVGKESVKP